MRGVTLISVPDGADLYSSASLSAFPRSAAAAPWTPAPNDSDATAKAAPNLPIIPCKFISSP